MPGIVAETTHGGLPVGSPGVTNAYTPPATFTVTGPLRFYGADCNTVRYNPQQINAFESELVSFGAALVPTGTWDVNSVTNLATLFAQWLTNFCPPKAAAATKPAGGNTLTIPTDYYGTYGKYLGEPTGFLSLCGGTVLVPYYAP